MGRSWPLSAIYNVGQGAPEGWLGAVGFLAAMLGLVVVCIGVITVAGLTGPSA